MSDATRPATVPMRSGEAAPFVYFDNAPAYGIKGGMIEVELTARALVPNFSGGPVTAEVVPTARLRCSPVAAARLIDALNRALDLPKRLKPTEAPAAVAAAGDKLN